MVVPANSAAITVSRVAAVAWGRPMPLWMMKAPPSTKALTPPLPKASYMACQSPRVAKPAVAARIDPSASMPSPTAPK